MLLQAERNGLSPGDMILKNELAFQYMADINKRVEHIWDVMTSCIVHGFESERILDGGLNLTRRAPDLLKNKQIIKRL